MMNLRNCQRLETVQSGTSSNASNSSLDSPSATPTQSKLSPHSPQLNVRIPLSPITGTPQPSAELKEQLSWHTMRRIYSGMTLARAAEEAPPPLLFLGRVTEISVPEYWTGPGW